MKILIESIDATGEFAKSPAYKSYTALLADIERTKENADPEKSADGFSDQFYKNVEMLIRYGDFRKIGNGSSRIAYSFDKDPRYVLKFAYNDNGLKQNRIEIKNAKLGSGDYECTVRILEYDDDNILIVEDKCQASRFEDWDRIIGISPHMLSKIVRTVFKRRETEPDFSLRDLLDEIKDPSVAAVTLKKQDARDDEYSAREHPNIVACIENILNAYDGREKSKKWVALSDLFRFYFDNGISQLLPEELLYAEQWGVVKGKTPDEDALIIIDPGVDDDFMPFNGKFKRVQ